MNARQQYAYDELGRMTGYALETELAALNNSVTYQEGLDGNTTDLVSQYTNEDVNAGIYQQYDYEYDAKGNIISITDAAGQVITYTYDGLNRLISESDGTTTLEYFYNVNGNLTSVIQNSVSLNSYTYGGNLDWTDQLTAFDNKAITYDALGNPLTYDGKTFNWQRGRQLAGITGGGQNISYTYDAAGLRTNKTVDNVTTTYLYSGDMLMRQQTGNDVLDFAYDANRKLVGFNYNGTPYFYLRNLQNDVVAIVDAEGTIVAEYEYNAWGNATILEASEDPGADTEAKWLSRMLRAAGLSKYEASVLLPEIKAMEIWDAAKLQASMEDYFTQLGSSPSADIGAWISNLLSAEKSFLRADDSVCRLAAFYGIDEAMLDLQDDLEKAFYGYFTEVASGLRTFINGVLGLDLDKAFNLYAVNAMVKSILRFYFWFLTADEPDLETDMAELLAEIRPPADIPENVPLRHGLHIGLGTPENELDAVLPGVFALNIFDLEPLWTLCETMEWERSDVEQQIQTLNADVGMNIGLFVLLLATASPQALEAGGPLYVHFASVLDSIRGHIDTTLGNGVPEMDLGIPLDASTAMAAAILAAELVIMGMHPAAMLSLVECFNLEPEAPPPEEPDPTGPVFAYDAALAALNPIRYRGYYYDDETGYYFLQTRYYSPEWRRFLNADSTFIAGDDALNGSNMYAYCDGNPVMYADPSGMESINIFSLFLLAFELFFRTILNYRLGKLFQRNRAFGSVLTVRPRRPNSCVSRGVWIRCETVFRKNCGFLFLAHRFL